MCRWNGHHQSIDEEKKNKKKRMESIGILRVSHRSVLFRTQRQWNVIIFLIWSMLPFLLYSFFLFVFSSHLLLESKLLNLFLYAVAAGHRQPNCPSCQKGYQKPPIKGVCFYGRSIFTYYEIRSTISSHSQKSNEIYISLYIWRWNMIIHYIVYITFFWPDGEIKSERRQQDDRLHLSMLCVYVNYRYILSIASIS